MKFTIDPKLLIPIVGITMAVGAGWHTLQRLEKESATDADITRTILIDVAILKSKMDEHAHRGKSNE